MAPKPDRSTAPDPDASAQEIAEYLSKADPKDAQSWLKNNAASVDLKVLEDVFTRVNMDGRSEMDPVRTELVDKITKTQDARSEDRQNEQKIDAVAKEFEAEGQDPETARANAERALDPTIVPDPPAVLAYTGGRTPGVNEQNELVKSYNEMNPSTPIRSYGEFAKLMNEAPGNPALEDVAEFAFTGTEPVKVYEWEVKVPGQGSQPSVASTTVRLSENEFMALKNIYGAGFSSADVKKLAQVAARIGLSNATGITVGDPAASGVGWQILAAGAAAMGMFNIGTRSADAEERQAANTISPAISGAIGAAGAAMDKVAATSTLITSAELTRLRNWGLQFKTGLTMYQQNDSLAFLHAMNPSLATRVSSTPIDKLSPMDFKQAKSYMMNAGFSGENLAKLGYGWSFSMEDAEVNVAAANAGPTLVRQMPDPEALRQSAKDMYRQLYAMDPTDEELDKLVSGVTGAILGGDIDGSDGSVTDVNPSAQIRKQVEGLPQYQELYGKKPGGMSEEEYQNQFRQGAASIIGGAAADPHVIRAGMRQGDYNTSVGAAAMTRTAWEGSSFLGRLAQAAQITSENT